MPCSSSGTHQPPYILNQNHPGYLSSKDQTRQGHLLRPDHWFWLWIIKNINAESALFTLSCVWMNFLTSRGSPHMILNSIFCRDEFLNVPKYAYDDRLTKLTVFGVVRDKWCRWKISRQYLVTVCALRGRGNWFSGSPKTIVNQIFGVDEFPLFGQG